MAYAISLMVYQIGGVTMGVVRFGPATVAAITVLGIVLFLLFRPDPNKQACSMTNTCKDAI